ncbi:MAG: GAF domain-containing protein [Bacteroidales bacterium]
MNVQQIISRIEGEIADAGSLQEAQQIICNILSEEVEYYNWVGFYMANKDRTMLELGAYVGETTEHTHIPYGKGVCGQVAESRQVKVVQDVRAEDNYISCSMNVRSEIVVPMFADGEFVGEIDIDSNTISPFTKDDERLLLRLMELLEEHCF